MANFYSVPIVPTANMATSSGSDESIKVVFRVRPLNSKEEADGRTIVTTAHYDRGAIEIRNPASSSDPPKVFTFDSVFGPSSSQRQLYDDCASPIVQSVLEGYNGSIFAYGQTGAGKSHTMVGRDEPSELRGIIPNAFEHIYEHVGMESSNETSYLIRASYYEIYNENVIDLLVASNTNNAKQGLELKESPDTGVYIKGLTSKVVKSVEEINSVLRQGNKNRSVAATLMNQGSSRSHAVFCVVIESQSVDEAGVEHIRVGKLNLVDLAGSERQSKTGATGERLKEATKINLSLSALGNVISALVDGKSNHIPYRDSKLTRILQDSLGGNTRTVMCANAGPADYNFDETLSTLRYANRAKQIKNRPVVNEDPKDAMLREYKDEISSLRKQLEAIRVAGDGTNADVSTDVDLPNSLQIVDQSLLDQSREERDELRARLEDEAKARADMETQREELQKRLAEMENQVVVGGSELERYASLEEEVEAKTKKLQRLYRKCLDTKKRLSELTNDFAAERSGLLEKIDQLETKLGEKEQIVARIGSILSGDVFQLSLDMPGESAKGYTPEVRALLDLPSPCETLQKEKKKMRSGGEKKVSGSAAVARPLLS